MLYELTFSLLGLLGLAYALEFVLSLKDDSREPRRLSPRIPLIGHVYGIVKYGTVYYNETRYVALVQAQDDVDNTHIHLFGKLSDTIYSKQTEDEIYTLDIVALKIYVARSRRLMPLIQKASKTLSFRPFVKVVARKMAGNTEPACSLFDGPFVDEYSQVVKTALLPGAHQDVQNLRMADSVISLVNHLAYHGKGKSTGLVAWTQHLVVEASSCGFFGLEHPFQDPEIEKAFWRWQLYLRTDMAGLDFRGQAPKEREIIHQAMYKYCRRLHDDVSKVVMDRQRILKAAGMDFEDAARQETLFCVAMFGNTTPTLYWTIWELFSRPSLVEEIRKELEERAVIKSQDGAVRHVLDIAALKRDCPLLVSTFQEAQRMHHVHANIRKVMEDTFIDNGRYLLRKGNYLQMTGVPIHYDEAVYGPTAKTFDPYRFVDNYNEKATQNGGKCYVQPPSTGFFAWGTPPHLCPARQFAAAEIMITVALLVLQCDLIPVANEGQWTLPELRYNDVAAVLTPLKEFDVQVVPRPGAGTWTVEMGRANTSFNMA